MMLTRLTFIRAALAASLLACLMATASPAVAQKEWTVHSFRFVKGEHRLPNGSLIHDRDGNLYGTTYRGGTSDWGTVYELVRPVPPKTAWTEIVLFNFTGGTDGGNPDGGLVFDDLGNLYGTTINGGTEVSAFPYGCGVAFELSPPAIEGSAWTESVLHSFAGPENGDGANPQGELISDGFGNLYGVTAYGGVEQDNFTCNLGCGTVFQLSPPATPGGVWAEAILHAFVPADGGPEIGPQVLDSQGDLYGTAGGGPFKGGVVYRLLRPPTAGGAWIYTVLHAFRYSDTVNSPRGKFPSGALTLHGKGVLYGTTQEGGLYDGGTVFQLVPPTVAGNAWTEKVLYSFQGGSDAISGEGYLIFDSAGNIYGTTYYGGTAGSGTVFQLTPSPSGGAWTEKVLHSFGQNDGAGPLGGLVFGKNGVLFGATQLGGRGANGAVYGLLP